MERCSDVVVGVCASSPDSLIWYTLTTITITITTVVATMENKGDPLIILPLTHHRKCLRFRLQCCYYGTVRRHNNNN